MEGAELRAYLIAKLDDCLVSDSMSITHELVLEEDAVKAVLEVLRGSEFVTRCKDCKWGKAEDSEEPDFYQCHFHGSAWHRGDYYCGYAEQKDGKRWVTSTTKWTTGWI